MAGSDITVLAQLCQRQEFERNGTGAWTTVYRRWHDADSRGGQFSVFAPKHLRSKTLDSDNWDVHIGFGLPGFLEHWGEPSQSPTYARFGNDQGFEPLVIVQDHYGIRLPMVPRLSEEFQLYHNLWMNNSGSEMFKIHSDGREELVGKIADDEVLVRTNLLKQFQAGRQLDLVLYIDSMQCAEDTDERIDLPPIETDLSSDLQRLTLRRATDVGMRRRSWLLGKKILESPEIAKAGIPPWSDSPNAYQEFIIGEDENGDPIEFTCDPSRLANFFGANPDAPNYVTPVCFEREVLQKYYNNPGKYCVDDGSVSCGSLWILRLDNNHPEHVMAMLGDLGEQLPETERLHWLQHNVVSSGGWSETAWTRWFAACPANPESPDLRFKLAYDQFKRYWRAQVGWDLFKDLIADDLHAIQGLRIPVDNNEAEFENQLIYLSKLLIESLDQRSIQQQLYERVPEEKGIDKLERWMQSEGYPHADRDVTFLRRLQTLRNKLVAHRKGSDYTKTLQRLNVDSDRGSEVASICSNAAEMLRDLAQHFEIDSDRI